MDSEIESIEQEFFSASTRLAVFDREIREEVGQWSLNSNIEVTDIIGYFSTRKPFVHEEKVLIPLHRQDEPVPTGEYLEFRPNHIMKCLVYYDFAQGKRARIPYEEFGSTYPATRIHLWGSILRPRGSNSNSTKVETSDTTGEIIDRIKEFINYSMEIDREETRQRFERQIYRQTISEVDRVVRIQNLGLDSTKSGDDNLHVRIANADDACEDIRNMYNFFEGDEVIIGSSNEIQGFPIEAEVSNISESDMYLRILWSRQSQSPPDSVFNPEIGEEEFFISKLLNPITFDRQRYAANKISNQEKKLSVLQGKVNLTINHDADAPINERRLNESQYSAAMNAVNSDSVYCIHGPPGTGKTQTLVEIIRGLALRNNRILVCSHSNQAIDNLLAGNSTAELSDYSSLHAFIDNKEISAARVGSNTSHSLVENNYLDNDPYKVDIVCGTTSSVHDFGENIFDYAILDEAAQASVPSSLIPYSKAKKMILAGDHKQLPPYYSTEEMNEEYFQESLFEMLIDRYGPTVFTRLDTQYRMNKEIFQFPNQQFYDGEIQAGDSNRTWKIANLPPLNGIDISGQEQVTPSKSYYNPVEIEIIIDSLHSLLNKGIKPESIGIITPYAGQMKKLRREISERFDDEVRNIIKVDTIDSFQGGERDVIILSFVRSNPNGESGFLTFPKSGPRRLNVALTRAKKRCIIIGDFETLAGSNSPASTEDCSHLYRALYNSLDDRGLITERERTDMTGI